MGDESAFDAVATTFLKCSRDRALEAFAALRLAFDTFDGLVRVVQTARPASAEIEHRLTETARTYIASRLREDARLPAVADLEEAARTEVAYANLVKAANDRRVAALRCHDLEPAHRDRLIATAERVMRGEPVLIGLDPRASRLVRAQVIARELACLDPRNTPNPFTEERLRMIYHREHA